MNHHNGTSGRKGKRGLRIALLAVLASGACEALPPAPDIAGTQATRLVIVPDSVTLMEDDQLNFAAFGRTNSGDSTAVPVAWTASGGIIDAAGQFTAGPDSGDFAVNAASPQLKLASSSPIRVRRRPVATVSVTPASATLNVGQTVQLTVTLKSLQGKTLSGRVVTWSTSNGSVATVSAGLVTAVAAGSVTITATSEGKTGTAAISVNPIPVAAVSVTPASAGLQTGQTMQLTATPRDANGNALVGRTVTWTSSSGAASVNSSGQVTALSAGSATITATSETKTGNSSITVTAATIPVASVSVTPASANLQTGQTAQLTATPRDANGNALVGRTVTWSSSSGAASVNASGLVTALSAGSATITATSETKTGTSSIAVTVSTIPVASVSVTPASANLQTGQTAQLTATPRDANGNALVGRTVTWSSSSGAASVNASGLVTALSAGSATITATSETKTGTSTITVILVPVASVSVTPTSGNLLVGQTLQLTATPRDANGNALTGRTVAWSSNSSNATVSTTGLVTAVSIGPATITATSETKTGTSAITVTPIPVASVSVTPASGNLQIGQTLQLTATPRDANGNALTGRVVTWSSSSSNATVSTTGLVTAVSTGPATITATSETKTGTSAITVTPIPVASVSVTPASGSLQVGQTLQLTATPQDANGNTLTGRAVTWSTSNSARATVNANGLVTAVSAGSVTITATSETKSGTSAITVTPVPVASVSVSPASASVQTGQTVQLTATPRDATGNPLTGRVVTWSSSSGAASVNSSGLVTGVSAGSATITATSETRTGTATITVTTPPPGGGTILFTDGFETTAFASRGWYDFTATPTIAAQGAQAGSTNSLQVHYTLGATRPSWGGMRKKFTPTETFYISYWVKFSTNWVGSGKTYHPHEFSVMTTEDPDYGTPAFNHLTMYVEHNYQNGGIPIVAMQDGANIDQTKINVDLRNVTENRAAAGCNDGITANCYLSSPGTYNNGKTWKASTTWFKPNPGPGYKGDWHFVEVYFQLNSIQAGKGMNDGVIRYWFDGQMVFEYTNVLMRTGIHATQKFNQLLFLPHIGDGSPVDQTMWIDNFTIATGRP